MDHTRACTIQSETGAKEINEGTTKAMQSKQLRDQSGKWILKGISPQLDQRLYMEKKEKSIKKKFRECKVLNSFYISRRDKVNTDRT